MSQTRTASEEAENEIPRQLGHCQCRRDTASPARSRRTRPNGPASAAAQRRAEPRDLLSSALFEANVPVDCGGRHLGAGLVGEDDLAGELDLAVGVEGG